MLQKSNNHHMSFLTTHSGFNYRPLSEATEILDTDYEAEYSEDESPRRSVESVSCGIFSHFVLIMSPNDKRSLEMTVQQPYPPQMTFLLQ